MLETLNFSSYHLKRRTLSLILLYNYPPKGRWIVMNIYRDTKRRGIYPPLFTDPEGDSCFSIYQIRWIKKMLSHYYGHNFFFWNFCETTRHFSLRSQNSEYPRIFQVTGANQNVLKLIYPLTTITEICPFLFTESCMWCFSLVILRI